MNVQPLTQEMMDAAARILIEPEPERRQSPGNNGGGGRLDVQAYLQNYGIEVTGTKEIAAGTIYMLRQCVFDSGHRRNEAGIIQASDGRLMYQCFHTSCSGRTWKEAREVISGGDSLGRFVVGGGKGKWEGREHSKDEGSEAQRTPFTWADAILAEDEFLSLDVPEKRSFLHPWLTEQSITLISGYRGTGKTWAALGIIDAITTATSFGPWAAREPIPCMLVDGELPIPDIKERMRSLNGGTKRAAPFFIASDAYANTLGLPRAHLANQDWRTFIKSCLVSKGIKLLVLDNLASLSPGLDENSKQDWDPINQWLLELRFAGISTVMLHHTNKAGDQRGISSREDNIDTSILLKRPPGYVLEDGCRFIVSFTKARVRDLDKDLISEIELAIQYVDGKSVWTWGSAKVRNRDHILRMLDEGASQADIASELKIDKGYVSRVRRQAIKDGFMTEKNRLTQRGFSTVLDPEI